MSKNSLIGVIDSCEVCSSASLLPVLDLGEHPLCDDLLPIGSGSDCVKYPLQILYCADCNTAHQKYQVDKSTLFPREYHYRSRFTADVLLGMENLVEVAETNLGSLKEKVIVDVGCNDGSLLDLFSERGAKTIGVEPTEAIADADANKHLLIRDFFSQPVAIKLLQSCPRIDIITFTNVFAHIENLPDLLRSVEQLMNDDTLLIVENHYLGSILEGFQFDTFYHEHPRTYSLNSFLKIAELLGREVISVDFPKRYGGNIRVVIGKSKGHNKANSDIIERCKAKEQKFLNRFRDMQSFISEWRSEKKRSIKKLVRDHGCLPAKAFPGRAAILIGLLDLSEREIEAVYEKPGSLKIGNYVPGTRIPIKSDEEFLPYLEQTNVILNLAWHIPHEIDKYLRNHGFKGHLVNIM